MTIQNKADYFSPLPSEVKQYIIKKVGAPAKTSRVSKDWNDQTKSVVKRELQQVWSYLNPGRPFTDANLTTIQKEYKQTMKKALQKPRHLFPFSLERFIKASKREDTIQFRMGLRFRLPKNRFRGQSLEDVREHLKNEIMQAPEVINLPKLSIQGKNLHSLPPEIGLFTNLTTLDLFLNKLATLPPEIGNLTNLKELMLHSNHLAILPPEIGNLTNLTKLSLVKNHLKTLPSEIGNLKNLTLISLCENPLTALPDTLAHSNVKIQLSHSDRVGIRAPLVYHFFQLTPPERKIVYENCATLAINTGKNFELSNPEYGKFHVFDSEKSLENSMSTLSFFL